MGYEPNLIFSLEMAYWQIVKWAWPKQTPSNGGNIINFS
jgi:hypothetical protein